MNILFKIIILVFCIGPLRAQTSQEIFLQANKLYDEKEFVQAYELYQSIEQKDVAILYNMGNCSYKIGNYVGALACWHQAQKNAGPQALLAIQHNISIVGKQLGLDNQMGLLDVVQNELMSVSLFWLQMALLFFWFSLFFFIKKCKRGTKYRMFFLALLFLSVISSAIVLIIKYHSLTIRKGIVMESNVSIFAGPDEQYHVLASVPQASCVHIDQQRDQWCKIKHKNVTGWVLKDTLTVV